MWHYAAELTHTETGDLYQVIEVYNLTTIGEGIRYSGPTSPMGKTKDDLIGELELMLADIRNYPVVELGEDDG